MKKLLTLLLCAGLFVTGCQVDSKEDFVNTANTGTFIINGVSLAVEVGAVDKKEAEKIEVPIRWFNTCMIGEPNYNPGWYYYLMCEENTTPPDLVQCATDALFEILLLADKQGIEERRYEVTNEDLEMAKWRLETAINKFYSVMAAAWVEDGT